MSRRQRADLGGPARDRLLCDARLFVSFEAGCRRRMGLVGDAFGFLDPLYSSGVLLACVRGKWPPTRSSRARQGRRQQGAARGLGSDLQRGCGSHAAAGLRVLRWVQLRRLRPPVSASARHHYRSADRRLVHGSRRHRVGTDGIVIPAPEEADSAMACGHAVRADPEKAPHLALPDGRRP